MVDLLRQPFGNQGKIHEIPVPGAERVIERDGK
ncbi:hypothetical protein ABIA22_000648 [Sinorhizobium fredii]